MKFIRSHSILINETTVDHSQISEWRINTLDCVDKLGYTPTTCGRTAKKLLELLTPISFVLQSTGSSKAEMEAVKDELASICQAAYDFTMMIRRSKEGYRCEQLPTRTDICLSADYEDFVEPMDVEGGNSNQASGQIAYALFGGLTKNPGEKVGGRRVLEKASVILRAK